MSSTKPLAGRRAFVAAALLALSLLSGCAAMRDPDDSDLPWAETHSWETQPALPQSMLN